MDWPPNMIAKRLHDGSAAYYWSPHVRYLRAGFTLHREALGPDYGIAIKRAADLNRHLDDWRRGRSAVKDIDLQPGFGTLEWLVERYKGSNAWTDNVSARPRYEYERALNLVPRQPLASGAELGSVGLKAITARGVDKLCGKFRPRPASQNGRRRFSAAAGPRWSLVPRARGLSRHARAARRAGGLDALEAGAPAKPFLQRTARNRVRAAARVAKLAEDLTLAACRHGGLTELGDAELTEQGVMALSGHKTPEASRLYVKRTETQRTAAARKRRAWVDLQSEQDMDASRNRPPARESEDAAK